MDIRPIRTEADHRWAKTQIDRLWGADRSSPEGQRLEVLVVLVSAYEEEHYKIPPPDPIDAIEFEMERQGLKSKDLEEYIGTRARVWEILNRKRRLTLAMIRQLEKGLGIPAAILVQEYEISAAEQVERPSALVSSVPTRSRPRSVGKTKATDFAFVIRTHNVVVLAEPRSERGRPSAEDSGEVIWNDPTRLDSPVLTHCH